MDNANIPAGLDEFLASGNSAPTTSPMNTQPPVDTAPASDVPHGLDEFIGKEMNEQKYGTPLEMAKTGLEGFAQGVAGPLAPMAERAMGVNPEGIRARQEANPVIHMASQLGGLIAPAALTGGESLLARSTLGGVLEGASKALIPAAGETLASKMGTTAAKAALENAMFTGSDEVSKMILQDPNQSAETAMVSIGLAGVLGAGVGGTFAAAPSLLKAVGADKLGKVAADAAGEVKFQGGTDHTAALTKELQDLLDNVKSHASTVSDKLEAHTVDITSKLGDDAVKLTDKEATKLREGLDKASDIFAPSLKKFEQVFTKEAVDPATGELSRIVDPGASERFINGIGKASSEIKQTHLRNFMEASEQYTKEIGKVYDKLGLESPITPTSTSVINHALGEQSLGTKLVRAFIDKHIAGATVAGAIGALGAHALGLSPELGAIISERALGKFFSSILPGLMKSITSTTADGGALKGAIEYASSVAHGEGLIAKAAKNIFREGSEVLSSGEMPTEQQRTRLDKSLLSMRENPEGFMNKESSYAHYLPEHSSAMSLAASNAATQIQGSKAVLGKKAPLDTTPVLSSTKKAEVVNAMNIAQQPLVIMDKIKKGTLTSKDIAVLGSIYPSLYNKLRMKLTDEMTNHISKGGIIPYKTRIGLSMFLAQPLDSTMSPMGIQAAQIQSPLGPRTQQDAPPSQESQASSPGVKSSPALQKMPNLYKTGSQARTQNRQQD